MRESLNLATAGVRIGNARGDTGFGGRSIGDRALFPGGRVGPNEGDRAGAFNRGESVRIEYCIADAVGCGVRVAILHADGFPSHRNSQERGTRGQKLSVRGLRCTAKIGTERGHCGRPRAATQAREARHGEGSDDPDQAGQHHCFYKRKTGTSE